MSDLESKPAGKERKLKEGPRSGSSLRQASDGGAKDAASKTSALLLRPFDLKDPNDRHAPRSMRLIRTKTLWDVVDQKSMAADVVAEWIPRGKRDNEGSLFGMVIGRDRNGGYVVLDVRPDVERAEFHGKTPEAALDAFVNYAEAHYPEGTFKLEVGPNAEGIRPQRRAFETQVKFHIDKFGEKAGWGSLGLTGLGLGLLAIGVTAPAGAVLIAAAALGVEASASALAGHNADPETTEKQFVIDGMQLLASLVNLRALSDLAKLAMQVPNVAKGVVASEFVLNAGSIGMIAPEWVEEFVAVKDDLSLSDSERNTRFTKILLNVALQTGFLWLAKRGAQQELNQLNQSAPSPPGRVARRSPRSAEDLQLELLLQQAEELKHARLNREAKFRSQHERAIQAQQVPYKPPTPLPKSAKQALIEAINGKTSKIERWIFENHGATQKLPCVSAPGLSYHLTGDDIGPIVDNGLLANKALGDTRVMAFGRAEDYEYVWFSEGTPWVDTLGSVGFAIPTNRLWQMGGKPVEHHIEVFPALHYDARPQGVPFEELAVVMTAGNGYVIPLHVPTNWSGPPLPVHPQWRPDSLANGPSAPPPISQSPAAKRDIGERVANAESSYVPPAPLPKPVKDGLIRRVTEEHQKIESWASQNAEAIKKLPKKEIPGVCFHTALNSNVPGIIEKGLLPARALGRNGMSPSAADDDYVWFNEGQQWLEGVWTAFVIPTDRLVQLGATLSTKYKQPYFALHSRGVPFEEFAIVITVGNGYVIPIHIPSNWSGPRFPVPPQWDPSAPSAQ